MPTSEFNHGTRVFDAGSESRPLEVADRSSIARVFWDSTASNTLFPLNEPVDLFTHETDKVAGAGTSPDNELVHQINAIKAQGIEGHIVAVRVAHSTETDPQDKREDQMAKVIGSAANMTGVHALSYARGHIGVEPDLLVPGSLGCGRVDDAKNPVADAFAQVAAKLKAINVVDTGGPNRTASLAYRADFSDRFTYLVDPFIRVASGASIVERPAGSYAASMFVKKDKLKGGPYHSPSNQEVLGILGTARPISYFDGETDHEANFLNENGIATFIPSQIVQGVGGAFSRNGRILWGNHTASTDPLWRFVNVVRTRSTIEKAIINGFRPWAIDENMTAQHVIAVMRSVQELLDELASPSVGAILGGRVFWDRGVNSNASLRLGKLRVEFDAEEVPPLEDLIFGSRRNEAYFNNLAAEIQRRTVTFSSTIADYIQQAA